MPITVAPPKVGSVTTAVQPVMKVTATTYSSGICIGGLLTLPGMAPGSSGIVQDILVVDNAAQSGGMQALFLSAPPTSSSSTIGDAQTFLIGQGDIGKIISPPVTITFSTTYTGGPAIGAATQIAFSYALPPTQSTLFMALVATASRTQGSTGDIVVTVIGPAD